MSIEEDVDAIVRADTQDRVRIAEFQAANMAAEVFKDWLQVLVARLPKEELDALNIALLKNPDFVKLVIQSHELQTKKAMAPRE